MDYIDNKSFRDGGIVSKNQQLMRRNREKLDNIDLRIRDLNTQPAQFTFHETEVAYETFRLNDSIELIHQQLDELETANERDKSAKLLDLHERLGQVEKTLEGLEDIPYS